MATLSDPTVLFDMDGVLVDVSGSYRRAIQETASAFLGRAVTAGEVQAYKNRGGFNDDWRLTEAIVRDGGSAASFEEIRTAFDLLYRGPAWDGFIASEPALLTREVLESVRAAYGDLGIVTGRPRAEAEWTLRRFGWEASFPILVPMEDQDGRGKPDPHPLRIALSRFARERWGAAGTCVDPSRAAYIGDSIDDMKAARAAGVHAIGFVPPYLADSDLEARLYGAGADLVIRDHEALIPALASLLA